MTTEDPKSGAEPAGSTDPLSATGIFLNAFRTQPDQPEEPAKESLAPPAAANPGTREAKPAGPGEFTQMFGAIKPVAPAPVQPPQPRPPSPSPPRQEVPPQAAEEATRIFVRQAAPPAEQPPKAVAGPAPVAPAQRMKGFSSPGASDFASDDGSLSQFFRKAPASPAPLPPVQPPVPSSAPPSSMGATDLFSVRPAAEAPKVDRNSWQPSPEVGSVTAWMQKLSEDIEPVSKTQIFETEKPAPVAAPGQGEYTRIISGDAMKAAKAVPATPVPAAPVSATPVPSPPIVQAPAVEPPKVPTPKLAPPALAAPQTKLQQLLPILLVLNGFLLVVLIVLVVFVLLRK
jgi:hypothetical protein